MGYSSFVIRDIVDLSTIISAHGWRVNEPGAVTGDLSPGGLLVPLLNPGFLSFLACLGVIPAQVRDDYPSSQVQILKFTEVNQYLPVLRK